MLSLDASDPRTLQAALDSAEETFGTIDVVGHRSVPVPGSVETVDYRSQTPAAPTAANCSRSAAAATLGVQRGRRHRRGRRSSTARDRVDAWRSTAGAGPSSGIVENPSKLSDEFALVSPSSASPERGRPCSSMRASRRARPLRGFPRWPRPLGLTGSMIKGSDVSGPAETLAMFSVATVFLLLASLVAAAGFAVVAQRRLRQLGMLAAVGATQKHLRLVLLTNGAVVGTIAAVVGTVVGLALWLVFASTLESAVDHRIDRLSLPWALIAMAGLLAIAGATAAAWWPGRTVARLPVMLALSGRPPKPRPARHSAIAAAALIAVGIGCLALSGRDRPPLIIAGLLATILGSLLLGPLAIRTFSAVAGRLSIAPRLALRDLARYQARSGAALAAVTLALGIAATVVVTASAEEAKQASEPQSLSDRQIRVYLGPPEDARRSPRSMRLLSSTAWPQASDSSPPNSTGQR